MSEYKREKIIRYKIQYKPSPDADWRDLYTSSYTYWQAEMIVGYYKEYKRMDVRSEEIVVEN